METSSDTDGSSSKKSTSKADLKCPHEGCNASFKKKCRLVCHIRTHTGERPFKCEVENCMNTYTNIAHLRRHTLNIHDKRRLTCEVDGCLTEVSDKYNLKKHMKRFHNTDEYPLKCNICGQGFHRKRQLQQHNYIHTGDPAHKCNVCDQNFATTREFRRHSRIHTSYKCDCGMEFKLWTLLLMHKKKCVLKEEFKCKTCDKVFNTKDTLRNHSKLHIPNDEKEIFRCTYDNCERYYQQKNNLMHHIRTFHENIKKKIKCPIENCPVTLSKMQNLKKHLRVHELGVHKPLIRRPRWDKGIAKSSIASKLAGIKRPTVIVPTEECLAKNTVGYKKIKDEESNNPNADTEFECDNEKESENAKMKKHADITTKCTGINSIVEEVRETNDITIKISDESDIDFSNIITSTSEDEDMDEETRNIRRMLAHRQNEIIRKFREKLLEEDKRNTGNKVIINEDVIKNECDAIQTYNDDFADNKVKIEVDLIKVEATDVTNLMEHIPLTKCKDIEFEDFPEKIYINKENHTTEESDLEQINLISSGEEEFKAIERKYLTPIKTTNEFIYWEDKISASKPRILKYLETAYKHENLDEEIKKEFEDFISLEQN